MCSSLTVVYCTPCAQRCTEKSWYNPTSKPKHVSFRLHICLEGWCHFFRTCLLCFSPSCCAAVGCFQRIKKDLLLLFPQRGSESLTQWPSDLNHCSVDHSACFCAHLKAQPEHRVSNYVFLRPLVNTFTRTKSSHCNSCSSPPCLSLIWQLTVVFLFYLPMQMCLLIKQQVPLLSAQLRTHLSGCCITESHGGPGSAPLPAGAHFVWIKAAWLSRGCQQLDYTLAEDKLRTVSHICSHAGIWRNTVLKSVCAGWTFVDLKEK